MALSKRQLWAAYIAKNPHWLTDGAKLTPAGVKKLVENSYQHGVSAGQTGNRAKRQEDVFAHDFLNDIMGGGKA